MDEQLSGCRNKWVNKWVDGCMSGGWLVEWGDKLMGRQNIDRLTGEYIDVQVNEYVDKWMNEWMIEETDE